MSYQRSTNDEPGTCWPAESKSTLFVYTTYYWLRPYQNQQMRRRENKWCALGNLTFTAKSLMVSVVVAIVCATH